MVLVIKSGGAEALPEWQAAFAEFAPNIDVRGWDDPTVRPEDVAYALVWEPEKGRLAAYPNLRLIISAAAGVDHILADSRLPDSLPIIRMITPETASRMADFIALAALGVIRDLPRLIAAQRESAWQQDLTGRISSETNVGIMGLGQLGSSAALRLAAIGFKVSGWARSPKTLKGVLCFSGQGSFDDFLSQSDILVNLLPHTPETRGILDAKALARLPAGAGVINVGRGGHLDNAALIAALDRDHLSAAILDVFNVEPLPVFDPLWQHPKIIVTSHIASTVSRRGRARQAAIIIQSDLNGEAIPHIYNRSSGY